MEKIVSNVRLLEKEEFLDFSRQMESRSCKETCSFLVNNLFRRKDSKITDNNNEVYTNLMQQNYIDVSKSIVQRHILDRNAPQITRSMTFSTPHKQSITILTPTSTRTTLLTDKKATLLVNTNSSTSSSSSHSQQTSSILSTSPEIFNLLTTPSTKTELIFQGELILCRMGMERTVLKRLVSSTCLRKWERHRLVLDNCDIHSTTAIGFMETPINYKDIREIILLPRLNQSNRFCIQLFLENHQSLIFQTSTLMQRSQWFYSIQWRTAMVKFDSMMRSLGQTSEIPVQQFMDLISVALKSAIKDKSIQHYPLHALSFLLTQRQIGATDNDNNNTILSTFKDISIQLSQLLDTSTLTKEMCDFYNKHKSLPCYRGIILLLFKPVVLHILKHDINFSKNSCQFAFVQDYIVTVGKQHGETKAFLKSIHGDIINCPHRNVLPNMVSLCLTSLHHGFQVKKRFSSSTCAMVTSKQDERLMTFFAFLETMSEFDDWRFEMSRLLQSVPFSDESLGDKDFFKKLQATLTAIAMDERCEVHSTLLRVKHRDKGWFDLICPSNKTCFDGGLLYNTVLERLLNCCCKRKSFVESHLNMTNAWADMSIKGYTCAIELLVLTIEYNLLKTDSEVLDVKSALSATAQGKQSLEELNQRQNDLKELQQKEGPLSLTLPARSTDADLSRTLGSGPFGNLESLNLAFTMVTSSCALDLIKLPSLKYLNLWATKFGDDGLQIICEHMPLLQVLNLCETPVTDKGLRCLPALKNLQKLNLNSTNLSAVTFEALKEKLPSLQEFDVCYTDAW